MIDVRKSEARGHVFKSKLEDIKRVLADIAKLHRELSLDAANAEVEAELLRLNAARTLAATDLGLAIVREVAQGRDVIISVIRA